MIEVTCSAADLLPIDAIEEFQGNLKTRTKADIEQIITSITKYGFSFPFFVWNGNGHNYCLDGHGRIQALAEMRRRGEDIPLLPVAYIEAADEAEAKQKLLRMNSQFGKMSFESVIEFVDGMKMDWSELALPTDKKIDFSSVQEKEIREDAYEVPLGIRTAIREGDLIEIGHHRLFCGDCRDRDSWRELMENRKADLIITDPPYNNDYVGKTRDALAIENDDMDDASFYTFLYEAFSATEEITKPGGAWYVWHSNLKTHIFVKAIMDAGIGYKQVLIWAKNTLVLGRQDYQWKHEPCLYGWKPGASHYFTEDRTHTTLFEDPIDLTKLSKVEMLDMLENMIGDRAATTVIHCDKPGKSLLHPTMKPIKLLATLVKNSSRPGELVCDGFMGSGSTMVTAHQTDRICYGIELDPTYCQATIDRMEALDPSVVIKIRSGIPNA